MVFDCIERLRDVPIKRPTGFCDLDYFESLETKRRYFREKISLIEISKENPLFEEPLFRCKDFDILEKNYYLRGKGLDFISLKSLEERDLHPGVFLRESLLRDLKRADDWLKKNSEGRFCLIVLSGYRSQKLQEACRKGIESQKRAKNAKPVEELFSDHRVYSSHATGAAFDLEVWDIEKSRYLPTKFLNREETRGGYRLEEVVPQSARDEAIKKNRRLLYNLLATEEVLEENHFVGHPGEYWHFGRNERLSAFFAGEDHPVYYDMI